MAFLQGVLAKVVEWLLQFLWGKAEDYKKAKDAQDEAGKEIEDKNKAVREKNESAVTPEERDAAAGAVFDHYDND